MTSLQNTSMNLNNSNKRNRNMVITKFFSPKSAGIHNSNRQITVSPTLDENTKEKQKTPKLWRDIKKEANSDIQVIHSDSDDDPIVITRYWKEIKPKTGKQVISETISISSGSLSDDIIVTSPETTDKITEAEKKKLDEELMMKRLHMKLTVAEGVIAEKEDMNAWIQKSVQKKKLHNTKRPAEKKPKDKFVLQNTATSSMQPKRSQNTPRLQNAQSQTIRDPRTNIPKSTGTDNNIATQNENIQDISSPGYQKKINSTSKAKFHPFFTSSSPSNNIKHKNDYNENLISKLSPNSCKENIRSNNNNNTKHVNNGNYRHNTSNVQSRSNDNLRKFNKLSHSNKNGNHFSKISSFKRDRKKSHNLPQEDLSSPEQSKDKVEKWLAMSCNVFPSVNDLSVSQEGQGSNLQNSNPKKDVAKISKVDKEQDSKTTSSNIECIQSELELGTNNTNLDAQSSPFSKNNKISDNATANIPSVKSIPVYKVNAKFVKEKPIYPKQGNLILLSSSKSQYNDNNVVTSSYKSEGNNLVIVPYEDNLQSVVKDVTKLPTLMPEKLKLNQTAENEDKGETVKEDKKLTANPYNASNKPAIKLQLSNDIKSMKLNSSSALRPLVNSKTFHAKEKCISTKITNPTSSAKIKEPESHTEGTKMLSQTDEGSTSSFLNHDPAILSSASFESKVKLTKEKDQELSDNGPIISSESTECSLDKHNALQNKSDTDGLLSVKHSEINNEMSFDTLLKSSKSKVNNKKTNNSESLLAKNCQFELIRKSSDKGNLDKVAQTETKQLHPVQENENDQQNAKARPSLFEMDEFFTESVQESSDSESLPEFNCSQQSTDVVATKAQKHIDFQRSSPELFDDNTKDSTSTDPPLMKSKLCTGRTGEDTLFEKLFNDSVSEFDKDDDFVDSSQHSRSTKSPAIRKSRLIKKTEFGTPLREKDQLSQSSSITSCATNRTMELIHDLKDICNRTENFPLTPRNAVKKMSKTNMPSPISSPLKGVQVDAVKAFDEKTKKSMNVLTKISIDHKNESALNKMELDLLNGIKDGGMHMVMEKQDNCNDSEDLSETDSMVGKEAKKAMDIIKVNNEDIHEIEVRINLFVNRQSKDIILQPLEDYVLKYRSSQLNWFEMGIVKECHDSIEKVPIRSFKSLLQKAHLYKAVYKWLLQIVPFHSQPELLTKLITTELKLKTPMLSPYSYEDFKKTFVKCGISSKLFNLATVKIKEEPGKVPSTLICVNNNKNSSSIQFLCVIRVFASVIAVFPNSMTTSAFCDIIMLLILSLSDETINYLNLELVVCLQTALSAFAHFNEIKWALASKLLQTVPDLYKLQEIIETLTMSDKQCLELAQCISLCSIRAYLDEENCIMEDDSMEEVVRLSSRLTPIRLSKKLLESENISPSCADKLSYIQFDSLLSMLKICMEHKCERNVYIRSLKDIHSNLHLTKKRIRACTVYQSETKCILTFLLKEIGSEIQSFVKPIQETTIFKYLHSAPVEEEIVTSQDTYLATTEEENEDLTEKGRNLNEEECLLDKDSPSIKSVSCKQEDNKELVASNKRKLDDDEDDKELFISKMPKLSTSSLHMVTTFTKNDTEKNIF